MAFVNFCSILSYRSFAYTRGHVNATSAKWNVSGTRNRIGWSACVNTSNDPSHGSHHVQKRNEKKEQSVVSKKDSDLKQDDTDQIPAIQLTDIPQPPTQVKRKRGRPKGSKNKKKIPAPTTKRSISAKRQFMASSLNEFDDDIDGDINLNDMKSFIDENGKTGNLRAPNGLKNQEVKDFVNELLPILAKEKYEKSKPKTEQQRHVQQLIETCFHTSASMHRSSDREYNLKPFRKRKLAEGVCPDCEGSGMTVCEYCQGQGFVDLGENAKNFNEYFGENRMVEPKHVMGNIYFCPLCGALQKERCVNCLGSGILEPEDEENISGAAKHVRSGMIDKELSFQEVIESEKDRIEIGADGIMILRAKKPKRKRKKEKKQDKSKEVVKSNMESNVSKRTPVTTTDESLSPSLRKRIVASRTVGRTTDFVNTTDYQVSRRLRKRKRLVTKAKKELDQDSNDTDIDNQSQLSTDENVSTDTS